MADVFQVVVADDVCRFALYVWRYLSRSIGFGTSDMPNDPGDPCVFRNVGRPRALATTARDADVWWVNISGDWKEDLVPLFRQVRNKSRRLFLVDVHGPYHASGDVGDLVRELDRRDVAVSDDEGESEVQLVSSYTLAPQAIELPGRTVHLGVRPKSPETLAWIDGQTRSREPGVEQAREPFSQVLVTGAGFEFHDRDLRCRRLGMRFTADVLERALNESFAKSSSSGGFFLPSIHADRMPLQTAARRGDLDGYWNEFLLLELARIAKKAARDQPRPTMGEVKLQASRHEYQLRESFRQQLVADDWGFLGQTLDVLRLQESQGLAAWLTTNYTRFADRAIELWALHRRDSRPKKKSAPAWRIVSTGTEAERLLREFIHGTRRTEDRGGKSVLFKLHGDLAHLLTMAIAGHDKDIFSPLSLPIASLHAVYVAAALYLKRRLDGENVLWHVVGHGLKDNLLVEVLADVCGDEPERHWFVVVDPKSAGGKTILSKRLGGAHVLRARLNADEYMARIVRIPPPALDQLEGWIEALSRA